MDHETSPFGHAGAAAGAMTLPRHAAVRQAASRPASPSDRTASEAFKP